MRVRKGRETGIKYLSHRVEEEESVLPHTMFFFSSTLVNGADNAMMQAAVDAFGIGWARPLLCARHLKMGLAEDTSRRKIIPFLARDCKFGCCVNASNKREYAAVSENSIDAGTGLRSKRETAPPLVERVGNPGGGIGMYPERLAQG